MGYKSLGDLTKSISMAVSQAQDTVNNQYFKSLAQHFDTQIIDEEEVLVAKMLKIKLSNDDTSEHIEIPSFSLAPTNGLDIERVEVELDANIVALEERTKDESDVMLDVCKNDDNNNSVKVKIVIKKGETPEAMIRLKDSANKYLP